MLGSTRAQIAAEKAGIVQPDSTLVLGETDPELAHFFTDRGPGAVLRRDVDFGVRENTLAVGGRLIDLYTPDALRTKTYCCRCTARIRPTTPRSRSLTAEAFLGAPLDPRSGRGRVGDGDDRRDGSRSCGVSPSSCSTVRTTSPARRRCAPSLDEEFATGPRTLVVGLLREKDPHEMLARSASTKSPSSCAARRRAARALDPELIAAAARDLGLPDEQIEVAESVERGRDDGAAADARRRPGRRSPVRSTSWAGPIAARPTLTRECRP